jgi:hypothetical protein
MQKKRCFSGVFSIGKKAATRTSGTCTGAMNIRMQRGFPIRQAAVSAASPAIKDAFDSTLRTRPQKAQCPFCVAVALRATS